MSTDQSRKSIGFRIYQEFCRMFPTALGNVNPVEMSPFLMTMRLIKQFYGFSKPEVYGTLIALLQDYDPSLGVKHRERTMRYIRLLLVDQPDLADYLLYLLPECERSNDSEVSQQQQPQPSRCSQCLAKTVHCEKGLPPVESLREEPSHSNSLLQRMVVLPVNESFQDFTSTAVRIAPAMNSAAGVATTASTVLTFGKSSKITLPHLVKSATGQVKRLQVHSKPTTLSTLLYNPNVVIKSELLTDTSSIVTLPRISSTVAATAAPISAVQDAGNPLARQLGLKLATHITASPKDSADKAAALSSVTASLLRTAPIAVLEGSCNRDNSRASEVSLDDRLQNIIKRFGKETQASAVRVTSSMNQQTAERSLVPPGLFCSKLSSVRSNDTKDTIVVQKQPEFVGLGTHRPTSVANGLVRCMPPFSQSQPMFVIEKTRRNLTANSLNSAGIRIIKKSRVSTSELPPAKFDKQPSTVAESSPLISLKKLVAGVGLTKSFENDVAICHSPTVISSRDAALDTNVICDEVVVCDKLQGEPFEDTENYVAKEADQQDAALTNSKSLLDHTNLQAQEDETKLTEDSFRSVFESGSGKAVCLPSVSIESEGRLSPYSDETSHSLLMNDGTSDYHVSDEEQALPTGGSIKQEIKISKCSLSDEPLQRNPTFALGIDAQQSNEEPLCKKMRAATSADVNSQYEGCTYLARLMELPSPPNYGHDHPWNLIADDRKRKGKITIKRKRKK